MIQLKATLYISVSSLKWVIALLRKTLKIPFFLCCTTILQQGSLLLYKIKTWQKKWYHSLAVVTAIVRLFERSHLAIVFWRFHPIFVIVPRNLHWDSIIWKGTDKTNNWVLNSNDPSLFICNVFRRITSICPRLLSHSIQNPLKKNMKQFFIFFAWKKDKSRAISNFASLVRIYYSHVL